MRKFLIFLALTTTALAASSQNKQQAEGLIAFAKAYGYVRYFHPADEASQIDWGKFSAYGAAQMEKCNSKEDVVSTLTRLFTPIAPSVKFVKSETKTIYKLSTITPEYIAKYQLTYWQHNGVSLGMNYQEGPYKSVRVNRFSPKSQSKSFANIMTKLDATLLKGKEIKYTGWVKVEKGTEGSGHLWFRVDKSDQTTGFFENMSANPISESSWKRYEIIGKIDPLAASLAFGCFLNGSGKLYVDNFQLFYKEADKWVEVRIPNSDFESDKIGKKSKKAQWIYRAVNGEVKLGSVETYEGNKSVTLESKTTAAMKKGKEIFKNHPKFGELIERELVDGVICQIPLALYCNKESTFPTADRERLTQLAEELNKVELIPNQLGLRMGNIINVYNVFQHFYPYFDVVDVDWENELEKALARCYTDRSDYDHLITLQKFTATLHDGHIWVGSGGTETFLPPLEWEWIENQLVITAIYKRNKNIEVGDIVTKINGQSPTEFFAEIHSRISAATKGYLDYCAQSQSLCGSKGSKLNLVVNGKEIEFNRAERYYSDSQTQGKSKPSYRNMDDDIFYVNLDLIKMDTVKEIMPELEASKAIIFDLRGYPNDNHGVISYLMSNKDTTKGWMQIPQFIYPDRERLAGFEKHDWIGMLKARKPYLGNKKVVFIIDGRAISYAESFMGYIEGYGLATIVGQPTAGTNGNVNPFDLPGGYSIGWTGMKVVKHDGSQHHGVGILPNVYVNKSIQGVVDGRDEFLEKAIEVAGEQ